MKLTRIDIYDTNGNTKIKANVNITIDDKIVIKNFKVVESVKGLIVTNPSIKGTDGKYYDTCYILEENARKVIYNRILDEFNKKVDKNTTNEL